jgi:hyperosmotically inducible protein
MTRFHRFVSPILALTIAASVACAGNTATPQRDVYLDTEITAKVKQALERDASLDASRIDVETLHGKVQLRGVVEEREDVFRAAEVASAVTGVRIVMNDLLVK